MSAGTCPRCGGDGTVVGRHVKVGVYSVVCHLCRGTGNYPAPDNAALFDLIRLAWLRLYVVWISRPFGRIVRRWSAALDRLGVDE